MAARAAPTARPLMSLREMKAAAAQQSRYEPTDDSGNWQSSRVSTSMPFCASRTVHLTPHERPQSVRCGPIHDHAREHILNTERNRKLSCRKFDFSTSAIQQQRGNGSSTNDSMRPPSPSKAPAISDLEASVAAVHTSQRLSPPSPPNSTPPPSAQHTSDVFHLQLLSKRCPSLRAAAGARSAPSGNWHASAYAERPQHVTVVAGATGVG